MDEEIENVLNRRLKRQLVYPFIEIEHHEKNDIFELWRDRITMTEIVEVAKDGHLLSIKEESEIYDPSEQEK